MRIRNQLKFVNSGFKFNHEAGEQALRAGAKVEEKAKKWTEKYAME